MTLTRLAIVIALSATSSVYGLAHAQQNVFHNPPASQSTARSVAPAQVVAAGVRAQAIAPVGPSLGFGVPPQSLKCLEWHCQGSECICLRFTTAE